MTNNTVEDRLNSIELECDSYLASLGLKVKSNPQFEQILQFNLEDLRKLDEEEAAEYAVICSLYSLYIQTEFNRHSRRNKWSEHNLSIVVGKYAKNYGDNFTKWEEKRAGIISENEHAKKLSDVSKQSMVYMESLNFISRKLETIANSLLELKRSKRKAYTSQ